MRARLWGTALALLCACSKISGPKGQPVALELRLAVPAAVEQNDTLQLHARALDENGDSIAVAIYWRVADTTLILVDSNGLVTTTLTSGTGRVQARVGTLRSAPSSGQLTIRPRSDTLTLTTPAIDTVPSADSLSDPLGTSVLNSLGVGVPDTRVLYEVVDTAAARGTVVFAGGGLQLRAATNATGSVSPAVILRKVAGTTPPASVQVRISATRPSGTPVPGSGQLFTILFQ